MSSKNTKKRTKTEPPKPEAGVFIYVGPTIRGVIQEGTVYAGTRADVLSRVSAAVDAIPGVADLIVPAENVSAVRHQIKHGTNLYSIAYRKVLQN